MTPNINTIVEAVLAAMATGTATNNYSYSHTTQISDAIPVVPVNVINTTIGSDTEGVVTFSTANINNLTSLIRGVNMEIIEWNGKILEQQIYSIGNEYLATVKFNADNKYRVQTIISRTNNYVNMHI